MHGDPQGAYLEPTTAKEALLQLEDAYDMFEGFGRRRLTGWFMGTTSDHWLPERRPNGTVF
jgi:hypothetical protein